MKKKKKRIVFKLLFACFTIYVVFSIVSLQLELKARRSERNALLEQVEAGEQNVEHLQNQLDAEVNENTVSKIARERLGYAYLDERIFVNISGD